MSTAATVRKLKQNDEDHEWYPTTDEIIRKVIDDASEISRNYLYDTKVLDVGAGDGRVLNAIYRASDERAECFAIEKAATHLAAMPKHIQIVGTDFKGQTLVDKKMDVVFCNPPYSEYEEWAYRLIREVNADYLYLVIPQRWRDSDRISRTVALRRMDVDVLGEFDFEDGDRKARAQVELIRFSIGHAERDNIDAFIEEVLPQLSVFDMPVAKEDVEAETVRGLVQGGRRLDDVLVESHDAEVAELMRAFNSLGTVDPALLKSLEITKRTVLNLIRGKILACKTKYWELLFNELDTLRTRLATKQRSELVRKIQGRACVDFTHDNILAVLVWVTKWANDYIDEQTVSLFRTLSQRSNCVRYKSNKKIWEKSAWRYGQLNQHGDPLGPYKLEYRMVLDGCGAICNSDWEHDRKRFCGLTETAFNLLVDIVVTANNLHFDSIDTPRNFRWVAGKANTMLMANGKPLVEVKAFKNGNMHMRFDPRFMLALNIEAGRLLGWIRNPTEACDEMEITEPEERDAVARSFGTAFHIGSSSQLLLGNSNQ